MKEYDKNDNDTYVELLSYNMAQDVEYHMFRNDKGHVLNGKVRGDFSVESQLTAQNNVFHFEKASKLGLQSIKHKNLSTLTPLSLMKRYHHGLHNSTYSQKTPIFFNAITEKFSIALDKRFLRDLNEYPQFKESIQHLTQEGLINIIQSDNEQIVLNYDSLTDLYNDTGNTLKFLKEAYTKILLDVYNTKDVIILAVLLDENNSIYFNNIRANCNYSDFIKSHIIQNTNIQFEFTKARKISDSYYYLYDNQGNLDLKNKFHYDKEQNKKEKNSYLNLDGKNSLNMYNNAADLLIIPYSEYDIKVLTDLKNSIDSIFKDLDNLLLKNKSIENMDQPINLLANNGHLLLTANNHIAKNKP